MVVTPSKARNSDNYRDNCKSNQEKKQANYKKYQTKIKSITFTMSNREKFIFAIAILEKLDLWIFGVIVDCGFFQKGFFISMIFIFNVLSGFIERKSPHFNGNDIFASLSVKK